jgi:hypothetical protein
VRFELALTQHGTDTLPDSVFMAPTAYKQLKLEPYLKQTDPIFDGTGIESLWNMGLSAVM